MSYQAALIGEIDIEGKNLGTIVLDRNSTLEELQKQYGIIGRGLHTVLGNEVVQALLAEDGVEKIEITPDEVRGFETITNGEQEALTHLFRNQYDRSERIFEAAQNAELEELDAVAIGVAKGVLLGGLPAVYFDVQGIQNIGTELGSRAGPGLIEASAISEEVEKISGGKTKGKLSQRLDDIVKRCFTSVHDNGTIHIKNKGEGKNTLTKFLYNTAYYTANLPFDYFLNNGEITKNLLDKIGKLGKGRGMPAELSAKFARFMTYHTFGTLVDTKNIVKRMPAGVYKAVDVGYWIERFVLRKEINDNFKTNNQRWADAQESGPYRGLIALGILKYIDSTVGIENAQPILEQLSNSDYSSVAYAIGMGAAIATAKFWINTGNNVQGINAVYQKYKKESTAITEWGKRKDAWNHLYDDAFQKAQIWICSGIYAIATGLEWTGMQAEKLLGNIGAAIQSGAQSGDTLYSAVAAKSIIKNKVLKPAQKSISDFGLMGIAQEFGSKRLEEKLKGKLSTDTFLLYRGIARHPGAYAC